MRRANSGFYSLVSIHKTKLGEHFFFTQVFAGIICFDDLEFYAFQCKFVSAKRNLLGLRLVTS